MRVPLQWLADYVDIELTTEQLARRLTMSGLKVDAIERIGADWPDVYVGEVIEVTPHPTSNKPLHVARVDTGDRVITVVTGAQNVRLGDKAPVVLVGGFVPHGPDGEPLRIEPRPMAGITSEGMLASARELGISEEHSGIYILPPEAPTGAPLRTVLGGDVLDIETNPNRPDTLSMIGIAREVAALTGQQMTLANLDAIENVAWLDAESVPVMVEDEALCPRYTAVRIEGVTVTESPSWLAQRLQAAGMRPINLVVDITNYVMLEYGQPMHAFDATTLQGGQIVVRRARGDECLVTLDGVERRLTPSDLVIADADRAVGIAGVMGGENSEIAGDTIALVLESATFDPISVRRTAQSLGLRTEASSRFEKGLPPELAMLGARRFIQLLAQLSPMPLRVYRFNDVWRGPEPGPSVVMPVGDIERLVGIAVPAQDAADQLSLLGFGVQYDEEDVVATVPYWRRGDVTQSTDLVEEVARMVGYEKVPATLPRRTMPPLPEPRERRLESVVREVLLAAGASEAVTHSLTSSEALDRLLLDPDPAESSAERWAAIVPNAAGVFAQEALVQPVCLADPPTRERQELRLTLLPSLLDVVARNLKQSEERVAFFELCRTFFMHPENLELPYERRTLAVALSGLRGPRSWASAQPGSYTFYDLKGMLTAVLEALGVAECRVEPANHAALHPGRAAALRYGGIDLAFFGELHPEVASRFGIEGWPVQVAEVDLDALFLHAREDRAFRPLPRYPGVYRDIAVVVPESVPAARLVDIVKANGESFLESATVFDVYVGEPLLVGSKSVAIGLTFRAPGATLTQDDVQPVIDRIVDALFRETGATLRE